MRSTICGLLLLSLLFPFSYVEAGRKPRTESQKRRAIEKRQREEQWKVCQRRFSALALGATLATVAGATVYTTWQPGVHDPSRLENTPDTNQLSDTFGNDGKMYCGPCAAANGLVWLAKNGYPELLPKERFSEWSESEQIARSLGNFGTGLFGISPGHLKRTILAFLEEKKVSVETTEFHGIDTSDFLKADYEDEIPSLRYIAEATQGPTLVLLNIKWATFDPSTNTYSSTSGHWVTLATYRGAPDQPTFAVRDPYPREGEHPEDAVDWVTFEAMPDATMSTKSLSFNTNGFYKVETGLGRNEKNKIGVLMGALIIRLEPPKAN